LKRETKRKRHSRDLIIEAIKRNIEDNASFRSIANRLKVAPSTILRWTSEIGRSCKNLVEASLELKPSWSGILGLDGKPIKISGWKKAAFLAVDFKTKDLVHLDFVDVENEKELEKYLLVIKDKLKYPCSFIISDLGKGKVLINLVNKIFPNVPHQACVIHFMRYVNTRLPKSKKSKYYKQNNLLREHIKKILFASNLKEVDAFLEELLSIKDRFKVKYQKAVIKSFLRHYLLLTRHFHYHKMPRDNNIVENVIKQLNRKLKQIDGFKNEDNAHNFLKLWAMYYRFKAFTDSKERTNNGKSPLQLAGVNTSNIDWLVFSKKRS